MTAMAPDEPSSIQTRPSLLNRLKTGDDTESWQEFYRIYGKLVRDFAIQAGLTSTEADRPRRSVRPAAAIPGIEPASKPGRVSAPSPRIAAPPAALEMAPGR